MSADCVIDDVLLACLQANTFMSSFFHLTIFDDSLEPWTMPILLENTQQSIGAVDSAVVQIAVDSAVVQIGLDCVK